jgi:hypothetical protein
MATGYRCYYCNGPMDIATSKCTRCGREDYYARRDPPGVDRRGYEPPSNDPPGVDRRDLPGLSERPWE